MSETIANNNVNMRVHSVLVRVRNNREHENAVLNVFWSMSEIIVNNNVNMRVYSVISVRNNHEHKNAQC